MQDDRMAVALYGHGGVAGLPGGGAIDLDKVYTAPWDEKFRKPARIREKGRNNAVSQRAPDKEPVGAAFEGGLAGPLEEEESSVSSFDPLV